ncbi:MAG: type III-B CRISPR module RAMP protein Cmr4 [Thermocrinis sp.]|uniref:type III-B CRISPR module RAMP protein Cmr4 n=1 Tax=Thermocrinis sp. TaxID=2024383 RepID=UPI003C094201
MRKEYYLLKVLTPLHIGAGQGLGHVDLPIVREAHTNFPYIPGTSLKGALRNLEINQVARARGEKPSQVEKRLTDKDKFDPEDRDILRLAKIFGTAGEVAERDKEALEKVKEVGAGKVLFLDAFIVLFPVKSAKGIFSLTTCPYVINRFFELLGIDQRVEDVPEGKVKVLNINGHKNLIKDNNEYKLLLEEFVFEAEESEELKKFVELVGTFVGEEKKQRIVCVNDTDFMDFVSNYTEVRTHIKINLDTGTVDRGALWTEEYVPAESIFAFSLVFLEEEISFTPPTTFHLGGDITTGKGFVKVQKLEV